METAIMAKRINKGLVVNGTTVVTEAAWNEELNAKHEKLVAWLQEQKLEVRGKRVGIILSGGNLDLDHLPWSVK